MQLALNMTFLIVCALCAIFDYLTFKIPNKLILVLLALFLARAAAFMFLPEFSEHLLYGGIALVAGFVLYALKIVGAGDAKFITVCILWISQANIVLFLLATSFAGGVIALIYLCCSERMDLLRQRCVNKATTYHWGKTLLAVKLSEPRLGTDRVGKGLIPYGVAIFIGVLYTSIITKGNF